MEPRGVPPYLSDPAATRPSPNCPDRPADPAATLALRPFVITAGRVIGDDTRMGFETQVSALPGARPARLTPEANAIIAICQRPISVAEVSARLRLHFGVTKILIGDLHSAGHIIIHAVDDESPDPDTILRVIHGLRAIF
ncbi:DUF742 domain-containing protein [Micromonospora echinofusca]|uniref:DUF742 domain-containing protein n=1 Tax=Micromonospora echinofusca TaxID=47858 RepID=A0ABS3VRB0_MICEH|nr:DUF742 domain-containing protein [Micromonospora echinofusca]MBO4207028.1 DUF742 domain-containing protein [Micromonospora echinofusca]